MLWFTIRLHFKSYKERPLMRRGLFALSWNALRGCRIGGKRNVLSLCQAAKRLGRQYTNGAKHSTRQRVSGNPCQKSAESAFWTQTVFKQNCKEGGFSQKALCTEIYHERSGSLPPHPPC